MQDSADTARTHWRSVAGQLRGKFHELDMVMDEAENAMRAAAGNAWPQAWTISDRAAPRGFAGPGTFERACATSVKFNIHDSPLAID